MSKIRKKTQATELSALAELLEYAGLTARELDQPFLAHLIQMAANESRSASGGQLPNWEPTRQMKAAKRLRRAAPTLGGGHD